MIFTTLFDAFMLLGGIVFIVFCLRVIWVTIGDTR